MDLNPPRIEAVPPSLYTTDFRGTQPRQRQKFYKKLLSEGVEVPGMLTRHHPLIVPHTKHLHRNRKENVHAAGFDSTVDMSLNIVPKTIVGGVPPQQSKFNVPPPEEPRSYSTRFGSEYYLPERRLVMAIKPTDDWRAKLGLSRKEADDMATRYRWDTTSRHEQNAAWGILNYPNLPKVPPPNTTFEENADMVRTRPIRDEFKMEQAEKTYVTLGRKQPRLPTDYNRWIAPIPAGQRPNPKMAEIFKETKTVPDKHPRVKKTVVPATTRAESEGSLSAEGKNINIEAEQYKQFHELLLSPYVSHPYKRPLVNYGGHVPTAAPNTPIFREPKLLTHYQIEHSARPACCYTQPLKYRARGALTAHCDFFKKKVERFQPRWK